MGINKTILIKLNERTKGKVDLKGFLTELIEFECNAPGWWEGKYIRLLEDYCKGDSENEI